MSGLIWPEGMVLLGKHPGSPVLLHCSPWAVLLGSATGVEKMPLRSSAVGTRKRNGLPSPGWTVGQISCEKKKNSLSRDLLKWIAGRRTGPPRLYPMVLKRFWLIGCAVPFQYALLK